MAVMGYTRGDILRYVFLPQVLPRVRTLLRTGFTHLAFFMAQVFRSGGIIAPDHPYLQTANIGKYGLMDVLSLSARNISFDRQHIDKVIFFFSILAGIVILAIQFFLLLLSMVVSPAAAKSSVSGGKFTNFLTTKQPEEDIAFRLMDRVFGIPDLFGSKDATATVSGFHQALHGLFQFYSLGLLVVAAIILAYFIAAIVAETAETGTPFGKRYNHVWAPVRLVVALGLLIPMGYGFNAAQWITLYAAKFGSGFATNGWLHFNEVLGEQYKIMANSAKADELVHKPQRPDIRQIVAFINLARTCKHATEERHGFIINAYLVKNPAEGAGQEMRGGGGGGGGSGYDSARSYFNKTGDIYIRFGELSKERYPDQLGYVYPYCGDIILPTPNTHREGAAVMNRHYYDLIVKLWEQNIENMDKYARDDAACESTKEDFNKECGKNKRPDDFAEKIITKLNKQLDDAIDVTVRTQRDQFLTGIYGEGENQGIIGELKKFGWGGAGIYYNTVAEMNGAIATSLQSQPYPRALPFVSQYRLNESRQENAGANTPEQNLEKRGGEKWRYLGDQQIYAGVDRTQQYWRGKISKDNTENIIIDTINVVLGTQALFDMCKNKDVHPLAQLAGVGRALMESATRNLGIALLSSVGGTLLNAMNMSTIGALASAASSFFITFAMIGLMIGFLMYYVVPFMPFLYFFFAVTGWVKGIFEAMVGVPLWALAHLRIDGQGLPGDAAAQGYFLILEIFLRPILIVFGLLAAISIFAAMVRVLNDIFVLVVSNVGGFNKEGFALCGSAATATPPVGSAEYFRGPVDQFFFTVVYAIVVYLIGTSTFKMIDAVPNRILRWMGTNVNSFGDVMKDAGEGLMNKLSAGGYLISGQLQGAFSQAGNFFKSGASAAGKAVESVSSGKPGPSGD